MGGFSYVKSEFETGQRIRTYVRPASDAPKIAVGDVVVINGTASSTGIPQVVSIAADTATKITGVVCGFLPDYANESLSANGIPASTLATLYVCDDPRALFEVECSATLAVTDVGNNAAITYTATTSSGNNYTSNLTLKSTDLATTATYPLQIVKLLPGITSGVLGDRALVRLNATTIMPGATGV